MIRITYLPGLGTFEASPGERVIDIARRAGVGMKADCGGRGKCGTCRFLVERASVSPDTFSEPTEDEKRLLPEGDSERFYRLACAAEAYRDATIIIPPETQLSEVAPRKPVTKYRIPIQPAVEKLTVLLGKSEVRGRALSLRERIVEALHLACEKRLEEPNLAIMADLSRQAVSGPNEQITATLFKGSEIIQLRAGARPELYGLALDLGTTSLAAFLCDLGNDRILAVNTLLNPQVTYGEDVISRIAHVRNNPSDLVVMQDILIEGVNHLIRATAQEAGISIDDIVDLVAVGNPTMQHFFLGLTPVSLGEAPYTPVCYKGGEIRARDLNIQAYPWAKVHLLPMLSGFIGGDTIAAMLTRSVGSLEGTNLMVDVGTNGELVLINDGTLTATSCATGPVFEGAQIQCGMRAVPGAIDRVWTEDAGGKIRYHVIRGQGGAEMPAGICGSGVISVVSALTQAGIIRRDGAFDLKCGNPALRMNRQSGQYEFVLVPKAHSRTELDIVFTQNDIRAVQLGKAALRAGIEIMMKDAGIHELDRIFLAGTFGSYLDPQEVLSIGMLPPMDLYRIESIGNAAGDGARLALFSLKKRQEAVKLAGRIKVVELSMRPDFQEVFVDSMHM